MALVVKDRVLETSNTNGTGTFTLAGAVNGFQAFSVIGVGNTTYYAITEETNNQWEVGLGTVGSGTLTRDTVLSSSNSGNKVDFADGLKQVFCDYPANKAVYLDASGNVSSLGTITSGVWNGSTIPVANGGTGVTTSSGANSVVLRDASSNITANALDDGYINTVASGTPIVLTVSSVRRYTITGSGGQTIKLPDATTLANGTVFQFDNNQSSGAITVNNNSNTLVVSVPSGGFVLVNLLSNAIAAGSWDRHDQAPSNVSWSTNTFDYAGSITSATWNGNTVAVNRGGTGATTLTGYVKGSGTSALTASSTIPNTDISGLGTMSTQNANAVAITGGTIDNTVIGGTTPAAGKFTTLESTGTGSFGTTSAQYIQAVGNATYPQIKAAGSGTDIPLILQPKGTGALQAQLTDSTATGGNARGQYAVDWQTSRNGAAQVASSTQSVVGGGFGNTASNVASTVAGGASNVVNQPYGGILSGQSNAVTLNYASVVGGSSNTGSGYYGFVGGGTSNSTTSSSAVTTQSATMNGTTAVTLSGSNANIKVGQMITGTSITFPNTYVAAISGTSLTLSQAASGSSTSTLSFFTPHGVVVGGGNNQATGSYSAILGGGDAGTAANRNVASGDWSVVCGGRGNQATGGGSVVAGGGTDGTNAFPNTATSTICTVIGGFLNNATAYGAAIIGGAQNTSNATFSSVLGGTQGTARGITGYTVFSASSTPIANASGASQSALLILGAATTDATATVLRSNTSAASGTNQVILPNNSAYFFTGEVVSGVTGGGNTKGWTIEGVIKRGAGVGTTALVGTPTVTSLYADAGAATWALTATADTINGGLAITFTGQAATTIRTVCQIRTTEMTY
jgi:hypothetical protein